MEWRSTEGWPGREKESFLERQLLNWVLRDNWLRQVRGTENELAMIREKDCDIGYNLLQEILDQRCQWDLSALRTVR